MGIPMALAFQMMGKLAEIPGRAKWQLQVIFFAAANCVPHDLHACLF